MEGSAKGSEICPNCSSEQVATFRVPLLTPINFAQTLSGTIRSCANCQIIFCPESTVSSSGEIGPGLLQSYESLLAQAARTGSKVVITTSSLDQLAHIVPYSTVDHSGMAYRIILGTSFHNDLGHLLIGFLQTIAACNTRLLERIVDLFSIEIAGYDHDPRPIWEIPQFNVWFFQLHKKVPSLPYWLSREYLSIYYGAVMPGIDEDYIEYVKERLWSGHPSLPLLSDRNRPLHMRQFATMVDGVWGEGNRMLHALFSKDPETGKRVRDSCTARINPAVKKMLQ